MRAMQQLMEWGYRPNLQGCRMLEYAANYARCQSEGYSLTKHVYPAVGRAYGCSAKAAEHSMRYAAQQAGDYRTVGEIVAVMREVCDPD